MTLGASEISITFLALFLLMLSAYIFGKLFEKIKAPKVVGEIIGGMVLGGSCLGLLFPELTAMIFAGYREEGKVLNIFYQLGLVFLMFSSGFHTSITISKDNVKEYGMLFFGATVLPMGLGVFFIQMFENSFIGTANNSISFGIVFLISAAITSIPVISKIFFDIGMMNTKFSNMVLTVSTMQDLCLWILLNGAISIAETGNFNVSSFLITTLLTIGLFVGANIAEKVFRKIHISIKNNVLVISCLVLFASVYLLSLLGINIMYAAFIAGYIMKSMVNKDHDEIKNIKDFSFAFFIPVYFALVGIQLDVIHNFSLSRFLLFFAIAFGLEFIGTSGVMLFSRLKKITVVSLGITMNARGGPGIVLATTAYAYHIINIEFFTVLIITTMLSSAMAGYWLRIFKNDIQDEG